MKKALLVSYVFPPMAAVGGQRLVYFCKYLRQFGWEPIVLTVKNASNVSHDPTMLDKIPGTMIYRARTFEPLLRRDMAQTRPEADKAKTPVEMNRPPARPSLLGRLKQWVRLALSVPDHAIFWVPLAVLKGLRVIRRERPLVIFSSSPPVSSHIVGSILSRLTGLPHLVDFRDLWTLNHLYDQRGYPSLVKSYDKFWESVVLKRAAEVVTASPGFTRQMMEYRDGHFEAPVETITNGFDYEETKDLKFGPRSEQDPFRFLYVGSLYADFNPEFFFDGLAAWLDKSGIDRAGVRVDFYGNSGYDYGPWLAEAGLDDVVKFRGFKPRTELLPLLTQVDCLLLFLGFRVQASNVIPAKLFEYLASGTPILATSPRGVTSDMIDHHQAGFWLDSPDQPRLIKAIDHLYSERARGDRADNQYKYIPEIDRAELTKKLAGLFDRLTG